MNKLLLSISLLINPIYSMDNHHHHHHHKNTEGVVINIDQQKPCPEKKDDEARFKHQLKIAFIGAGAVLGAASIAAVVTLAIHYSQCNK